MSRTKSRKRVNRRRAQPKSRRVLAYPLALFMLMVTGVYLAGWTLKASGADVLVTAKIHGPAVTSPAVITSPVNGQHFKSNPISVSGTCPTNAAYVEIFRGSVMSGSAICQADASFKLSVNIFSGRNDLTAHVFNITDDEGPVSDIVSVFYDAPNPPPPTSNPAKPQTPNSPFGLSTTFLYKGYYTGQTVVWPLSISGGQAPYALNVDWGDGQSSVISQPTSGDFNISHKYTEPGGYRDSYTIKVSAADSNGQAAFIQFFVIVNTQAASGLTGGVFNKPPPTLSSHSWLWLAWPVYLGVLAMFLSFWLGEREELIVLRKKGLLTH